MLDYHGVDVRELYFTVEQAQQLKELQIARMELLINNLERSISELDKGKHEEGR